MTEPVDFTVDDNIIMLEVNDHDPVVIAAYIKSIVSQINKGVRIVAD